MLYCEICTNTGILIDYHLCYDRRRVITVINSNDPVARALTLRTLGALSPIIPERKPVHHKVRCGLDSQDSVELEAAIYAATRCL